MSSFNPDKFRIGRKNDASSARLREEIEQKAEAIKAMQEDKVFDAERHVKDSTEEYYEEILLEGDQFLRMDGIYEGAGDLEEASHGSTKFATYRGQRIAYTVTGSRSGQPVVVQHGFLSNKEAYADYANALSEAGFLVICTESLGHGESDKPSHASRYSLQNRAGDVAAVLDAEGIEKAHFIGYSMGGWIGTGMAKFQSDRLLSLTIGGWDPLTPMAPVAKDFDLKRDFLTSRLLARPDLVEWFKEAYIPGLTACWAHLRDKDGAVDALIELSTSLPVLLWTGRNDGCHAQDVALAQQYAWSLLEVDGDHMAARSEMVHQGAPGIVAFLKSGGTTSLDSDALSGGLLTAGARGSRL